MTDTTAQLTRLLAAAYAKRTSGRGVRPFSPIRRWPRWPAAIPPPPKTSPGGSWPRDSSTTPRS
ncbi:hypothetical protein [Streptomyces azureus]|uniref:hypothetical protein n=1 Tax=Streptomyces azureus TaxID=146537 RepID=UPI0007511167|nr:hypothetical protein [Streptomyces azureus]